MYKPCIHSRCLDSDIVISLGYIVYLCKRENIPGYGHSCCFLFFIAMYLYDISYQAAP